MGQTATYGKHTLVGGLTWVALSRPREAKKEAIATATRYEGDCYIIRSGSGLFQVGVGRMEDGAVVKGVSSAALIANAVASRTDLVQGKAQKLTDWLGIFKVNDDAYAFVAVRDGSILPQGDQIGTYDEAISALEHTYGLGGWTAVFAPEEASGHGYFNFVALTFEELLKCEPGNLDNVSRYQIKKLGGSITKKQVMALGAVLGVAAIAVLGYITYQSGIPQITAFQPAPPPQPKRFVYYEKNWGKLPAMLEYGASCEKNLGPLWPAGWELLKYECVGTGSVGTYKRNNARLLHLLTVLPTATVNPVGDQADFRQPLVFSPPVEEELLDWSAIDTVLRDQLQASRIKFTLGPERMPPPPPIPPDQVDKVDIVPPYWREYPFAIGPTPAPPSKFIKILDYPGVRFSKIIFQKGNWGYEGIIYAKR